MEIGSKAPDFCLPDAAGKDWKLSDQTGKVVVLLFYPGDNTPVCTKQLCSVRDNWDDFAETGAEIVGISMDSVESHHDFAKKFNFPFTLLSDENGDAVKKYGVDSWIPGRSARAVSVIDKKGNLVSHDVQSLSVFRPSNEEVLKEIASASNEI